MLCNRLRNGWRHYKQLGSSPAAFLKAPPPEAFTQQLLVGSKRKWPVPNGIEVPPTEKQSESYRLETVVYKEVSGTQIYADIYIPLAADRNLCPLVCLHLDMFCLLLT
jgi:hypothetical protein